MKILHLNKRPMSYESNKKSKHFFFICQKLWSKIFWFLSLLLCAEATSMPLERYTLLAVDEMTNLPHILPYNYVIVEAAMKKRTFFCGFPNVVWLHFTIKYLSDQSDWFNFLYRTSVLSLRSLAEIEQLIR